jgi:ATP-dependent protease ClpP protease subunit
MNDSDTAEIFVYDEIGYFGITAGDFTRELAALDAPRIALRINSPGGGVFDGHSIANALRRHPATVDVTVDGVAASIASVIAMAGDTVTMGRGTRLMIHDPSGLVVGQATDMRKLADTLDELGKDIAGQYADRAGRTVQFWLDKMSAETWYGAQEAVDAGLADAVMTAPARPAARAVAWGGRPDDAAVVGAYSAWVFDYDQRINAHARGKDRNRKPDPRPVTVTTLSDGRVRRDIGSGLTVITPRARSSRGTKERSDATKARVRAALAQRPSTASTASTPAPPAPMSPAQRAASSAAMRQRHAARSRQAERAAAALLRRGGVHVLR